MQKYSRSVALLFYNKLQVKIDKTTLMVSSFSQKLTFIISLACTNLEKPLAQLQYLHAVSVQLSLF